MACKRRQLTGIHGFVQRKQNDAESRVIAVFVEQWLKRVNIFGLHWDIGAFITAELLEDIFVVVAECARVDLHDHAIFDTHSCQLSQHLTTE